MKSRLSIRSVVAVGAALFAVCAAGTAHAIPKDPVDPPDPTVKPPKPPRPPPPVCVAPTLTDCNDPTYLESDCGVKNRTACGNLVLPSYQAEVRAVSQTTPVLRDDASARIETGKMLTPVAMPAVKDTCTSPRRGDGGRR